MKKLFASAALVLAACSSTSTEPEPMPAPVAAADPRVAEMQTQLTELLERIDVLNDRIARFEEAEASRPVVSAPAPQVVQAQPAATPRPAASQESRRPAAAPGPQEPRSTPAPRAAAPSAAPVQRALVGADIAEDYRQAIMLVGRNRHAEARRAFESVYETDPNGDLADNALFWIGETYYASKDYTNAVRYYMRVVNDYATQNKAPDALFKTALAQERTGDVALARRTLQQVIERYPYSSPASTAKAELQRLRY
jgi:tol-pal system protein YbgF